ncbi:MAG: hypothetical protein LQ349_001964 [Xanthoria aureola]|nr:MAG: hypothetical protein LQ349_001964 [Xanthoria aureola]
MLRGIVEEEEEEEDIQEPRTDVSACLRVDKKAIWQYPLGLSFLNDFNFDDLEKKVDHELEKGGYFKLGAEIKLVVVQVKAVYNRATWKNQSMDELSFAKWIKVHDLIINQANAFPSQPMVEIRFSINAETNPELVKQSKKLAAAAERLEDTPSEERAEADEAVGKENKRLLDRWMCNDERCINTKDGRGYCYVDIAGAHYNMDQNQQLKWAKAIQQGETGVSIEIPPRSLYIHWTKRQGPVDGNSKAPSKAEAKAEARSTLDELKELFKFSHEMKYHEQLSIMLDIMRFTSKNSSGSQQPVQQAAPYPYPVFSPPPPPQLQWPLYGQPYGSYQQPLQAPIAPTAPIAPPLPSSAPPAAIQGPPPPERPRSSTPIAPIEEAANLEELFFRWKFSTVAEDGKEEYKAVERTIMQRRYKLAHIKAMSSPQNPMFHRAIELGIPDGIALNFKEDLKLFKAHWRRQSAAQLLASMRQN